MNYIINFITYVQMIFYKKLATSIYSSTMGYLNVVKAWGIRNLIFLKAPLNCKFKNSKIYNYFNIGITNIFHDSKFSWCQYK